MNHSIEVSCRYRTLNTTHHTRLVTTDWFHIAVRTWMQLGGLICNKILCRNLWNDPKCLQINFHEPGNCFLWAQKVTGEPRSSEGQWKVYQGEGHQVDKIWKFLDEDHHAYLRRWLLNNFKWLSHSWWTCTKFVPRLLNEDQRRRCIDDSRDMVEWITSNPSALESLVTCDESWAYCYDPETKRKHSGSPRNKKARQSRFTEKLMMIPFF